MRRLLLGLAVGACALVVVLAVRALADEDAWDVERWGLR